MTQELEIEFKNLLTKAQYQTLKQYYFEDATPFKQTNYYIDTLEHNIISKKMALRIREKNHAYEMTLKIPQKVGLLEINEPINSLPQVNQIIDEDFIPKSILNLLTKEQVPTKNLFLLGELMTYRLEKEIDTNLLVLDHSIYLNKEDYELEFEVQQFDEGQQSFVNILNQFHIAYKKPMNKVKRFFEAQKDLQ